ncbi:MAG: M56 family metallopeptidase [Oscillospiraceae bacterium]
MPARKARFRSGWRPGCRRRASRGCSGLKFISRPEAAQDPETRQFVLRHELAHYHARDQLWSLLRLICQCLYWFDPFVWLAAALSRRDCELACDERVLKDLDSGSRVSYGRALLGLVAPKRARGQLLSCATTMQLGRKSLRERITLIAKKPKMAAYTLVFVLVLSLVLTACTFTGAPAQPEPDPWTGARRGRNRSSFGRHFGGGSAG